MATLKQSTAYNRMALMVQSSDHITGLTGATLTVTLSKNGAAFGALGGSVTEVASGWYKIALNTTDTGTLGDLAYHITAASGDPTDFVDQVTVNILGDTLPADVQTIKTQAVTCAAGVTINANVGAAAAPGSANGMLIGGSNAATTFASITSTGSFTISDGLLVSRSSSNTSAATFTGNGTGSGIVATSGSGATGDGLQATSVATNGNGFSGLGKGTGNGYLGTGGNGTNGDGAHFVGGTGASSGMRCIGGGTSGAGAIFTGTAGNAAGIEADGQGSAAGIVTTGGLTGQGFLIVGGGTSGDGIKVTTTSGHGINLAPVGTSMHGLLATGGNGGTSDGFKVAAGTGGVGLRADTVSVTTSTALAALSCTTLTASGAVAFQSTFAVTTSTSLAALSATTVTFSGAVAFQSTFAVTTSTALAALSCTTLTASGAVAFQSTFATTGTVTFNAFTCTNNFTVSGNWLTTGTTTWTGAAAFSAGLTSNITGTLSTVTNLTNAPTSGDFTATMKTSLNAATPTLSAGDSPVLQSGTATAGGASTITIQTALGANSLPIGCTIKITSGTGAKQARVITAYVDSTQVVTVDRAWTTNPDNTSVYSILYTENAALSSGLKITGLVLADTLTTYTGNTPQTGDSFARIGATGSGLTSLAPSATALSTATWTGTLATNLGTTNTTVASNLDAAVSSRMATYTQPTGFLAATFPSGTIANTTNITAGTITTATNLTNAPTVGDFTDTMKTSIGTAVSGSSVANVSGDVGGNIQGSVQGSLLGNVVGSVMTDVVGRVLGTSFSAFVGTGTWAASGNGSALATASALATLQTSATAIKAKTDNLPSDPSSASTIATAFTTLTSHGDSTWATATTVALTSAYDFAKGTVALTESYRANGTAPTPAQAFFELIAHLGEMGIVGTTKTINRIDHTTVAETFTLNSATTPTAITRAT